MNSAPIQESSSFYDTFCLRYLSDLTSNSFACVTKNGALFFEERSWINNRLVRLFRTFFHGFSYDITNCAQAQLITAERTIRQLHKPVKGESLYQPSIQRIAKKCYELAKTVERVHRKKEAIARRDRSIAKRC